MIPFYLNQLTMIQVWHDNTGPNPGWFLDSVTVLDTRRGLKYLFVARRWLAKDESDGRLEITLEPNQVDKVDKSIPYEVTVYTGDLAGAGTDATVWLQIYGDRAEKNKTEVHFLRSRSDNFERGAVDKFKIIEMHFIILQDIVPPVAIRNEDPEITLDFDRLRPLKALSLVRNLVGLLSRLHLEAL
ncbi:unnamed protein product [Protopolystoma xenopodis]|uniref:PLAT domain-containing protein n=1 Tax=Protopolystoma xenopodis TaxID=117903 RepID=A0A448WDF4_9PLAT|nr:unnamed protein product [Protopolystoma xenopodis]